jgi:hypothetical protein
MFNLKTQQRDSGTWFYFNKDKPEQGGICLRELTPKELQEIEALTTTVTKKFKRGAYVEIKDVDEKLANKLRINKTIVDWDKVAIDGVVLKCTIDNKVRAMEFPDFVKFVADNLEILTENNASLAEAKLKNLKDLQDGNSDKTE